MKKTEIFFLTIILVIGFITRLYMLGRSPNGLYLDETSIGYNAYSILKTGKDEFGKSFPVVFRSFADFKTPLYIYFSIPIVQLLGLSQYSIRFLSAISGVLTILVLYLLVKILVKKTSTIGENIKYLPLISSLMLSISPWHILLSRAAFEVNLSVFLFSVSALLFYLSINNNKYLMLSAVTFGLTAISYHSQRIIVPIFLTILFLKHHKLLLSKAYKRVFLLSMFFGFIILLPTLQIVGKPGFIERGTLNIFNYVLKKPAGFIENLNYFQALIVNSPIFLSTREFASLYLSYFTPKNLFLLGDPDPRVSYAGLSAHYLWQTPFYLIGLVSLFKIKRYKELKNFVLSTLFLSPLPASLTRDPFTTIRSELLVIPLSITIGIGIIKTYQLALLNIKIPIKVFNMFSSFVVFALLLFSLSKVYSSEIVLNNFYKASNWNFGYAELSEQILKLDNNLPIVVDNVRGGPYSELLFFLRYDPSDYQKINFEVDHDQYYSRLTRVKDKYIGSITTKSIDWKEDSLQEKYLIGDSLAISDEQIQKNHLTLIDKIHYPDGVVAFVVTKTNPSPSP